MTEGTVFKFCMQASHIKLLVLAWQTTPW